MSKKTNLTTGKVLSVVIVASIVLIAIVSRIYNLNFQSLWLDEIYTMTTSDPNNNWHEIFLELKNDFHPPLHYLICNTMFQIVEYNDFFGRLLSATLGISGIFAMFWLGRMAVNIKAGYIMGLLTTFNYYHLYHSQEVRMYILLFLLTALTIILFIKFIRNSNVFTMLILLFGNVLILYTHYFGFFVVAAQGMTILHLFFSKKIDKNIFVKYIIGMIILIISYSPWIPYLVLSGGKDHWMSLPEPGFFFVYVYELTGKEPVSFSIILIGILIFIGTIWKRKIMPDEVLLFCISGYGLISIFVLGYFVSIFKPVMQLRCSIAAIPFFFLAITLVLSNLKPRLLYLILFLYAVSSSINILLVLNYYWKPTKENYRDLSKLIIKAKPEAFYISHYHRYYNYYFVQYNAPTIVYDMMDANLHPSYLCNQKEVVVLNAHFRESLVDFKQYKAWVKVLNNQFYIDSIYTIPFSETESAVLYVRKIDN